MSRYPAARRVELSLADVRRLTILERARACALAGIGESEIPAMLRAVTSRKGDPAAIETGVLLLYALAFQLERRLDPELTWSDAQRFDLALNLDGPIDPIAEAEASASVEAAIATGLPPAVAGELTLAQLDAYAEARKAQNGRPRRRRARAAR